MSTIGTTISSSTTTIRISTIGTTISSSSTTIRISTMGTTASVTPVATAAPMIGCTGACGRRRRGKSWEQVGWQAIRYWPEASSWSSAATVTTCRLA